MFNQLKNDPEFEEKRRRGMRGVSKSPEHRRKIGEIHRGKRLSEEHRQSISKHQSGEGNNRAKLTTEEVREIRRLGGDVLAGRITVSELSRRYGVSRTQIRKILDREAWAHIA